MPMRRRKRLCPSFTNPSLFPSNACNWHEPPGKITQLRTCAGPGASINQVTALHRAARALLATGGFMIGNHASPLEASVLVLNKMFMAVHVINVRRAFILLCKDLAEVVSQEDGQFATYTFETWREVSEFRAQHFREEDDDWVRTSNTEIQVPRVIRLVAYEKVPKHTVKFNRRNIF